MPVVSVGRDALFAAMNSNFSAKPGVPSEEANKAFDELCFSFGIELDDVTSEKKIQEKETGKADSQASDEIIYKIDVPANRYDLLCLEGIARALRVFLEREKPPTYSLAPAAKPQKMVISQQNPPHIRPVVVCAVLRNIKFDDRSYKSFIDLQDKLHQNICRKRTLVSIGTHDLDKIEGPFTYAALPPKDIKFIPLKTDKEMDGNQLMQYLDHDLQLKKYLSIIRDSPVYPVILDNRKKVLSLPPIINGEYSKMSANTTNVFIEVTATDFTKADIVLNIMCTMFAQYCAKPFTIEPVEVVGLDGKSAMFPNVSSREMEASVDYIVSSIGAKIPADQVARILSKMSLSATLNSNNNNTVKVAIPCTRSDILHACDIMEDVAIAYGYNNLVKEIPRTLTYGKQQPLNKLTDLLRGEVAMAGYSEALTLSLCSREENFKFLNKPEDSSAVSIANPSTLEFQVARTSLLVGILKTVSHNRKSPLPIKVFEISDIVLQTKEKDVGATNKRNLCALHCGHTSGFEVVHGLLDTLLLALGCKWKGIAQKDDPKGTKYYELKPSSDATYFEGRRADIMIDGKKVGVVGTIHPQVLASYHIPNPCAALEFCIEPFV